MIEYGELRHRMVQTQIVSRGIVHPRLLDAFRTIPRERFVPSELTSSAYQDRPLEIGHGQTISQPFVVAKMITLASVSESDVVLDVGAGSGYQTALLAHIAERVFGVEIIEALADRARDTLATLAVENASITASDGGLGLPEHAPYDVILAAAAAKEVPPPLLSQLADGGRLVMPVGGNPSFFSMLFGYDSQKLVRVTRSGDRYQRETFDTVVFVPLTGDHGND